LRTLGWDFYRNVEKRSSDAVCIFSSRFTFDRTEELLYPRNARGTRRLWVKGSLSCIPSLVSRRGGGTRRFLRLRYSLNS
jgi:hypothetical protein